MRFFRHAGLGWASGAVLAIGIAAGGPDAGAQDLSKLYEAAKKEGRVTVYTDLPVEFIQQVADSFKKKYAGIEFDFFRGDTTQIMTRLESETAANRHNVGMLSTTANRSEDLAKKGWLAEYKSEVAKTYPKGAQPEHGLWYNYGVNTTSWAYNTKLVKDEEAPKTFNDLLDPKWKGKIGMQDPKSGGGGAHTWIMAYHRAYGEEKWHDFMAKLGKQIGRYGTYVPMQEALAAGEIHIHMAAYPDFIEPLKQKGAPVEWAVPAAPDYMLYLGLTLQISKHAPQPNAARLVLEHMLSSDVQKILATTGRIPAKPEERPDAFKRFVQQRMVDTGYDTIYAKRDKAWFDENIKKHFAPAQ
jgi:iron(III) transport system substrate-binding protein